MTATNPITVQTSALHRFALRARTLALFPVLTLLTGCMSLTGLDAESSFSCNTPMGSPCQTLPEAYEKSVAESASLRLQRPGRARTRAEDETLPRDQEAARPAPQRLAHREVPLSGADTPEPVLRDVFYSPTGETMLTLPRRVPEEVLTLFVAPWTDADGDLHEGETVYLTVSRSHWAEGGRRAYFAQKPAIRHVGELTRAPLRARRGRNVPEAVSPAAEATDTVMGETDTVPETSPALTAAPDIALPEDFAGALRLLNARATMLPGTAASASEGSAAK